MARGVGTCEWKAKLRVRVQLAAGQGRFGGQVDSLEQSAAACVAACGIAGSWFIWSLGSGEFIYLLQPGPVCEDYFSPLHSVVLSDL